jgi:transaldolase
LLKAYKLTKIFCDIADVKLISKFNKKKIVKGFTTNPSLMRKAGAKDYSDYSKKILKVTKKPLSLEVFADNVEDMITQGKMINNWGKNIYVKVPVNNSRGKFMGKVIRTLNNNRIKLNITAVYTAKQTRQILNNIDKKTKVIISIFAGRMGDTGKDPIPQFRESVKISKNYKNVEILWASTREPYNYIQAKQIGCQIITVPPAVKGFLRDAKKSNFNL